MFLGRRIGPAATLNAFITCGYTGKAKSDATEIADLSTKLCRDIYKPIDCSSVWDNYTADNIQHFACC